MGGYSLAIPANIAANRIPDVWRAIQALTTSSATKLYLASGSLANSRISVSRDPGVSALSPMISAVDDMAQQGFLRMWPHPPVSGIAELIVIAGEELHDILSWTKTARQALATAQRRAEALPQVRQTD